jgi:hypothetical protein
MSSINDMTMIRHAVLFDLIISFPQAFKRLILPAI